MVYDDSPPAEPGRPSPTAAFKDLPLQFTPRILSEIIKKETIVLVATSEDTGRAALEGFKNVKLAEKLENLSKSRERVYCMFNNYEMFSNASKLLEILQR
ncbi:hypothetical protein AKJ37_05095 [candidate division MSBL1 archaeon SCGC-AAA259I09]|uniref:Uncharacterized protein n=1 Tax=candidate division MSBL1 archaeon SCGC-AAA259I09 TaxID=1698267 RepID=A0A133UQL1_9EURY|nr:hypothetical protein AKJ37_05095 [candidate division MSBL1 archaeon SCGC-AAA259I09]